MTSLYETINGFYPTEASSIPPPFPLLVLLFQDFSCFSFISPCNFMFIVFLFFGQFLELSALLVFDNFSFICQLLMVGFGSFF
jgi:hypothetical protein